DTQEAAYVARYTIGSVVASQALVALLGLLLQRCMAHDLQQLMEFCQPASQARLVGSPSHLAVPLAVAPAVQGKAQTRERLPTFSVPRGVAFGKATERAQTGVGRRQRKRELRQALSQRPREALCIGLGLEIHDEIINGAHQLRLSLQPWL